MAGSRWKRISHKRLGVVLAVVLVLAALCGYRWLADDIPAPLRGALLFERDAWPEQEKQAGPFTLHWSPEAGGRLSVTHEAAPDRVLWATVPGEAFAAAARAAAEVSEARGSFFISETRRTCHTTQSLDACEEAGGAVVVRGRLSAKNGECLPYALRFEPVDDTQLRLVFETPGVDKPPNRLYLTYASSSSERFFGFGEQFTHFDLKGRRVPILTREQGIGRGRQPLTALVNLVAKSGGDWHTSYAPVPFYMTSRLRALCLENQAHSVFDLRTPDRVQVTLWNEQGDGPGLRARIFHGDSPPALIAAYTSYAGRMRPPPDWILEGAVAGMQGGTEQVRRVWGELKTRGTPLAAFWLQDWVGQRATAVGKQLWWNWELDETRYPNWEQLRHDLAADGVRLMTYVNPFLANLSGVRPVRRDLFAEAAGKGYLLQDASGRPHMVKNTDFSAAMVDLDNPEACAWMKSVLREQVLAAGVSGWMADFGEARPIAEDGTDTAPHNRYPERWARLNREVVEESGRAGELVFFCRSGFTRSPSQATLFWEGDQLMTWDRHDGIKSAVTGLLSSGLCGFAFNHSDIGGYTAIRTPVADYLRDKELFMRWAELNAFSAVFRTHDGIRPGDCVQFYTNAETLDHFDRCARIYAAWAFYRKQLVREAAETGLPVVRHCFIHYPEDEHIQRLTYQQFTVGRELLVAPVLNPGQNMVDVHLPAGEWISVWNENIYGASDHGTQVRVPAPIGRPAAFYPTGSETGIRFRANLQESGLLP